jgi:hypothetical protein
VPVGRVTGAPAKVRHPPTPLPISSPARAPDKM